MKTLLTVCLLLSSVAYMASSRTFEEFLSATLPMVIFLNLSILAFFGMRWGIFGRPKINAHIILLPLYTTILSYIQSIIFYSAWIAVCDSYLLIHRLSPPRLLYVVLVGVLILLIGASLFFTRLKARFFFGLGEALLGFLIGISKIPVSADPITWNTDVVFVIMTASIFLIVRGFDNMHAGLSSHPDATIKSFHDSEYGRLLKTPEKADEKR